MKDGPIRNVQMLGLVALIFIGLFGAVWSASLKPDSEALIPLTSRNERSVAADAPLLVSTAEAGWELRVDHSRIRRSIEDGIVEEAPMLDTESAVGSRHFVNGRLVMPRWWPSCKKRRPPPPPPPRPSPPPPPPPPPRPSPPPPAPPPSPPTPAPLPPLPTPPPSVGRYVPSSKPCACNTVQYFIFEEGDGSRLLPVNSATGANYLKVSEKIKPDGTKQTIYFKKVKVTGGGQEVEIDWDDDDPLSTIRVVKEIITVSGQTIYKEFEGQSWREKILVTIPKEDGSDVTIFSKKFRVGKNGKEYEVDWDEEGVDIIMKILQRTIKPDGTIMITEIIDRKFPASSQSQPEENVKYFIKKENGVVDLGSNNQPTVASLISLFDSSTLPPEVTIKGSAFDADGTETYVYQVKVKEMEDGSQHFDTNSPGVRTKLFRLHIRLHGRKDITEVKMEVPQETTLLRIEKVIKRRPDGTLVEVDPDVDSEPNAEFVTRVVRTKKTSSKNQEIHIEDDLVQFTRKIYVHTKKGIIATDYRGGLVVRKYKSPSGLSFSVDPRSRNAKFQVPSRLYLGGDDILGKNEWFMSKLTDQLVEEGQNSNFTIADLPEHFLKRLSELFGTGFIIRPKGFTGSYVSSAGVGAEAKQIEWGRGSMKFGNGYFGLDKFLASSKPSLGGNVENIPFFKGLIGLGKNQISFSTPESSSWTITHTITISKQKK